MEKGAIPCSFCGLSVSLNVGQLSSHLTEHHNLTDKQTLLMAFIIVHNKPDDVLTELLARVDDRVRDLLGKHVGHDRGHSEEESDTAEEVMADIDEIQKRITSELDSDESDSDDDQSEDMEESERVFNPDRSTNGDNAAEDKEEPERTSPNVVIKTEIVDNDEQPSEESSVDKKDINIVDRFSSLNMCKLCYTSFEDKEDLRGHEETEHEDDTAALALTSFTLNDLKFSCPKCPLKFLTENLLGKHKEKQHQIKRMVKCRICQVSITPNNVNFHMSKHKKNFTCQLCYKTFKKNESMTLHCQRVHQNEAEFLNREITEADLQFPCDKCNLRFVSEDLLRSHTDSSHTKEQNCFDIKTNSYVCPLCHSRSKTSQKLKNHLKKFHSSDLHLLGSIKEEDYTVPCNLCDLKFLKETLMDFHRVRVHFPDDKKVPCDRCDKEIVRYNYSLHKSTHNTEKNFKCLLCNLKLKTKGTLKSHQMTKHTTAEEKNFFATGENISLLEYACSKCEKKFLSERLLNLHCKEHTKKRRECHICYRSLKDRYGLQNHLRVCHKDEKEFWDREIPEEKLQYSCEICKLKFLSEPLLKAHSSGHKVKACHLCYKLIKSTNLRLHMEKIHKTEREYWLKAVPEDKLVHPCDKCEKKCLSAAVLKLHSRLHLTEGFDQMKAECYDKQTKNYECKFCYKNFNAFHKMMTHMNNVHKTLKETWSHKIESHDLKCYCPQCGKKFLNENLLKIHKTVHNQNNFGDLRKTAFDSSIKRFKCKLCFVTYKHVHNLGSHLASIHEADVGLFKKEITETDLVFVCDQPECKLKFPSEGSLQYHRKQHGMQRSSGKFNVKVENKERYCQLCCVKYKKPHFLRAHKLRVHSMELDAFDRDVGPDDLKHPCSKCSRAFLTENTLNYHMKVKHYHGTVTVCRLCHIDFKNPTKFHNHKYKVHKNEIWAFKTEISEDTFAHQCHCSKKFLTQNSLDFHKVHVHQELREKNRSISSEVGNVKCQLCYEPFKKRFYLSAHMKKHDSDDRQLLSQAQGITEAMLKYSCRFCELKFVSQETQRFHTRKRHIQSETYCRLCYVTFRESRMFQAHKKNIHKSPEELDALKTKIDSQSLEFSCNYCEKKFLTINVLKYHNTYSHREERKKDITCEYCDKLFKYNPNRKANFENHMRRVHNLENFSMDDVSQDSHMQEPSQNRTVQNFLSLFNSLC